MATPPPPPQITLLAQCLCKSHTFTTPPLSLSTLPLKASSCHCTSCRRVTGALRSSDAVWPGPAEAIQQALALAGGGGDGGGGGGSDGGLRRYRHSERVGVLFCGRCGTGLFFEEVGGLVGEERDGDGDGEGRGVGERGRLKYLVFTGALSAVFVGDDGEEGMKGEGGVAMPPLVRWEDHVFVGDTVDGGASCWLRGMNEDGESVKLWLGGREESEEVPPGVRWPAVNDLLGHGADLKAADGKKGNVPIRCHCGGVDFVLRAGEAQREFEEKQKRGGELPWFVDPVTHKLVGGMDGCDSCRIWSGSEVFNWTFTLLTHLSFAGAEIGAFPRDSSQLRAAVEAKDGRSRDSRLGTLAVYASSPEVQRYFCGRCSASVFYAVDDRPDLVDVAVGLLDSPDGARADSVISWSFGGPMVWRQDMTKTWRGRMLHAVEKEVEEWRIERGYPKGWHRVAREQSGQRKETEVPK